QKVPVSSLAYWDNMSNIMTNIFSHGYSYYSLEENWIAAICGSLFWRDLAAIVNPEDIMRYSNAACSQQSIVLMECLGRKGIPHRAVMFPNHYAVEAYIENGWRYFDTHLEQVLTHNSHKISFSDYHAKGNLSHM